MRLYSQKDVDKKALRGARIAVLGYGSQGRAHALNLRDSGFDVVVGVRKGDSWNKAKKDGLKVSEPAAAVKGAQLVAMLVPDMTQKALYEELKPVIEKGATLLFAHGFNMHFKQIKPRKDLDVVLIAPKGPGDLVRRQYQQGRGVPCLIAVAQNPSKHAKAKALAYADGIGGTRGGVLETTFAEETETDLVRRAGRALRRRDRTRGQGLRDAGRGRLPARGRVLRVPARTQAHRRPAARGRHHQDAPLHQRDRQVRRSDARTARGQQGHQEGDEEDPRRDPAGQVRAPMDRGDQERAAQVLEAAEGGSRPLDREGRRAAARAHALAGIRQGLKRMAASTLFDKVWTAHEVVPETPDTPAVLYVDLHLIHEVTSPQAFSVLRELGLPVRRPDRTLATMDHSTPTASDQVFGRVPIKVDAAARQVRQLERNAAEFGVELFGMRDARRGIVHVISPELGATQPGMTIVCGDSHTSTHGAFGALAFGIGSTEVGHVFATQCLLQRKPKTFAINVEGTLAPGVTAKDLILAIIGKIGVSGGTGHVFEYRGSTIRALSMEERMTICNMSIEAGARAGMIAPDETTFAYLKDRPRAPAGEAWDAASRAGGRSRAMRAPSSTRRSISTPQRSSR